MHVQPSLALIIPSADRPEALEGTLHAHAAAGGPEILAEAVVVHKPGDDATGHVIEATRRDGWPVRSVTVDQPHGNAGVARNAGLATVDAQHVLFMDNDIRVEPDFYKRLAEHLRSWPEQVLLGRIDCLREYAGGVTKLAPDNRLSWFAHGGRRRSPYGLLWPGLFCARRSELGAGFLTIFRGWGGEDHEMGYRLFRQGNGFIYCAGLRGVHFEGPRTRSPFARRDKGELVDPVPFVDNRCRVMLSYPDAPELLSLNAYDRFRNIRWVDDNKAIIVDAPAADGYAIVARALESFRRRHPADPLSKHTDRLLGLIHSGEAKQAEYADHEGKVVIWPPDGRSVKIHVPPASHRRRAPGPPGSDF